MEEKDLEILGYLSIIKDPRLNRKKLHDLGDILFIGICATLCGCMMLSPSLFVVLAQKSVCKTLFAH